MKEVVWMPKECKKKEIKKKKQCQHRVLYMLFILTISVQKGYKEN
jgi:hypothetical protein